MTGMRQLGGTWRAAVADDLRRRSFPDPDLDDRSWAEVAVPGHWRSTPALAATDGPVLHRRRFEATAPAGDRRAWLRFEGIFYQGDVWLDGSYLGDTEGYFAPHTFEVTAALRERGDHLLAVEVACAPPDDRRAKRNLTGVFQHWDCIDAGWNPGGIWAPVALEETGPVRIASLRALCPDATAEQAHLEVEVGLDAADAGTVSLRTTLRAEGSGAVVAELDAGEALAAGPNRVRRRLRVERPALWWPRAMGDQPLHTLEVEVVAGGEASDRRTLTTGLRQVRMRSLVATVNGERLHLKGANLGPTRRAPAEASPEEVAGDVALAAGAGLDLLRVHAHVGRPELYDAADRAGMLLWQDLPLQWGYANVRRQAVRQAREAVTLLGHHPSVLLWCAHNEPVAVDAAPGATPGGRDVARWVAGQALPTWNRSVLDRSLRRALERADGSRPVLAHSGVLPHPAGATDSHLYFGWYHGEERDLPAALARLPALGRFVSEFGAQALPDGDEWLEAAGADPASWPDLDWAALGRHAGLQKAIWDRRVPPGDHATLEGWRAATQAYQAAVVRFHVEALRRLKYRPGGGFAVFLLADAQPGATWALLDHRRRPKPAFAALAAACAPVVVVADRPAASYRPGERARLAVHAVSDLRRPLPGAELRADLAWPGGGRRWRFGGEVGADSVARIGVLDATIPPDTPPGALTWSLELRWDGGRVTNDYTARLG